MDMSGFELKKMEVPVMWLGFFLPTIPGKFFGGRAAFQGNRVKK